MLLRASELNKHFKKITTGESVTCSVSCAQKYFEDKGTVKNNFDSSGIVWQDMAAWVSWNGPVSKVTQQHGRRNMTAWVVLLVHTHSEKQRSMDNFKLCSG